jgi:alkylation response protein AidB-like acyl-CoA dehydrogenase
MSDRHTVIRGGSFLIERFQPDQIFTPEDFSDEHLMIAKTMEDFVRQEVLPLLPEIEKQRFELSVQLLRKAGELGLLSADIPEKYGGLGLDKISSALITEKLGESRSFSVTFGGHVGIGSLPIVFFGTEAQKQKYLPLLATGEKIAAYALTEPSSGSDALGAKTTAKLSDCGQYYILNGEKQWITNSGFADLFIVYAKVDGEHFTAFIVERQYEGVSTGPEEQKMGLKGSSTRTLILNDVKVPVENVLGEIGKGHHVAFNILNLGRLKLALGCVGSTKRLLEISVKYAKQRTQFKQPIANFGLIQEKLANMAIRTYVNESMVYRTSGLLEQRLSQLSEEELENGQTVAKAIAEYAIECSINKVYGSEALDYVVDEAVQIHGGYGYMAEYEVENAYRDARINRIFEGTNEINRLNIPAMLMRKVMKGELPIMAQAGQLQEELMMYMPEEPDPHVPLAKEKQHLDIAKKLFLMVAGAGFQKFHDQLRHQQELVARLADTVIEIYAMESAILRAEKSLLNNGLEKDQHLDYTRVYVQEAFQTVERLARESLAAIEEGDTLRTMLAMVKKLTRFQPINTIAARKQIAARIIEAERYV